MKLIASLKRKIVHVFRQKIRKRTKHLINIQSKLAVYFTISHSKSILHIFFKQNCFKLVVYETIFQTCVFKIEILLIPLLQAISHIFEISEDDHPLMLMANAFVSPGVNSRGN